MYIVVNFKKHSKIPSEYSQPGFHGFRHLLTWQTDYSLRYSDWRECCRTDDTAESPGDWQGMGTVDSERTRENLRQMWHRIHEMGLLLLFFPVKFAVNKEIREKINNREKYILCAPTLQTQISSCLHLQLRPYMTGQDDLSETKDFHHTDW